jgi:hypothetical protein
MGQPIVQYEAGQTSYPAEAMSNTGDNTTFEASFAPWSDAAGFEAVIRPNGLLTGGAITPRVGEDNEVTVAPFTAWIGGQLVEKATVTHVAASRGADGTNNHRITSVVITAAGNVEVQAGDDHTGFSEVRGDPGAPPAILAGSIEIGQVRFTTHTAADVAASEILAVPGIHVERADYPVYQADFGRGTITFADALPAIHADGATKLVYVSGATPLFAPLANVADWVPAETTYSVSSEDTYDGPIGSEQASLGQASFTALGLRDGINDPVVMQKGKRLWFRFRPDRDRSAPYQLTQGTLGVSRTFPASGGSFSASCTITSSRETLDVAS